MSAQVDDEDFEWLRRYNWYAEKNGNTFYAKMDKLISKIPRKRMILYMHTAIMNTGPGMVVDHIDGNGANNQRSNLRVCTQAENARNSAKPKNGKLKYKGVSLRDHRKIIATICFNRKKIQLGSFATQEEAALAYNAAAIKYHGEFARLNIIPAPE